MSVRMAMAIVPLDIVESIRQNIFTKKYLIMHAS